MAPSDRDFYRARAEQEHVSALMATNECARTAHLELARLYAERLRQDEATVSPPNAAEARLIAT